MKSLLQAPGFSQDERGLLDAVIEHLDGADSASITELRGGAFVTLSASDEAAGTPTLCSTTWGPDPAWTRSSKGAFSRRST